MRGHTSPGGHTRRAWGRRCRWGEAISSGAKPVCFPRGWSWRQGARIGWLECASTHACVGQPSDFAGGFAGRCRQAERRRPTHEKTRPHSADRQLSTDGPRVFQARWGVDPHSRCALPSRRGPCTSHTGTSTALTRPRAVHRGVRLAPAMTSTSPAHSLGGGPVVVPVAAPREDAPRHRHADGEALERRSPSPQCHPWVKGGFPRWRSQTRVTVSHDARRVALTATPGRRSALPTGRQAGPVCCKPPGRSSQRLVEIWSAPGVVRPRRIVVS